MKRSEINIFNTSFLDLISGALGAVLILFVVIPKMTSEQKSALEEVDALRQQITIQDSLVQALENSVSADVYSQLLNQFENMRNIITRLDVKIAQTEQDIEDKKQENTKLNADIERLLADAEDLKKQNIDLQADANNAEQKLDKLQRLADETIFGIQAKFAVVIHWSQMADVHLRVKNTVTGAVCDLTNPQTNFGKIKTAFSSTNTYNGQSITTYRELFYQEKIIPGEYDVFVWTSNAADVSVSGYLRIAREGSPLGILAFKSKILSASTSIVLLGHLYIDKDDGLLLSSY
jgi:hypothetical protein